MKHKPLAMMSIRGATLASKFLLVMFLAKYASFQTLADYTLIAITISFLLYILGFDFYTFSSREILKKGFLNSGNLLSNQFYLYGFMYVVAIPIIIGLNQFNILNVGLLFYFVLITEHLAQECMRIIVINNNPMKANIQFFLRSSLWVYIYIAYSYWSNSYSLNLLLACWFTSNIFAVMYSLTEFRFFNLAEKNLFRINIKWIKNGLIIAIPLLITTLMLRGIYIGDRYFLKYLSSTEVLAVYSFYSSMSNALIAFIDAAVVMTFYPKLISAYNSMDKRNYNSVLHSFKRSLTKTGLLIFLLLSIFIPVVCLFLNKYEFIHLIAIFYLLLLSSFIYSYSLIFHYELYARSRDSALLISTGLSFAIGIALQFSLGLLWGGIGMAIAMLLISTILLISKYLMSRKIKKVESHFAL